MAWAVEIVLAVVVAMYIGRAIEQAATQTREALTRRLADPDDGRLSADYPVFSCQMVLAANQRALEATAEHERLHNALTNDPAFETARAQHRVDDALAARMLAVCQAGVVAEMAWYRHAALMDANVSARAGTCPRADALDEAERQLRALPSPDSAAYQTELLRNNWKARLEAAPGEGTLPERHAWSNPWFDWFSRRPVVVARALAPPAP